MSDRAEEDTVAYTVENGIAFELAVPIMREDSDDIRNFNFSVGWTR